ncbi:MAG: HAMP domain-containing histidine kinase [Alphaproteobacteria bacterium]|nr:HAMP domain-containing histidine kinase [Alphaproteobacteria bacterium]
MRAVRDPVKSIRIRYIIGLSALAVLIVGAHLILVRTTAERQEEYGRLIQMAGDQTGLMNRITLFASEMQRANVPEEHRVARQQIGRAISLMAKRHEMLVSGDPASDLPRVETPLLRTLYYDPGFGLDKATRRFLEHARAVYAHEFGTLQDNTASLVYLRTYGPYVLETLLNAAVDEYERFARTEMQRLKRYQKIAVAAALLLLLIEAFTIFRPLERKVREAFEALGDKNRDLEEARIAAEHANRAKSRFLSNISHELRTPLNAILGFTEALQQGVYGRLGSELQRARLDDVHAAAAHLLHLVNDVLELNQLDSGAVVLEESAFDPVHVMRQASSVLQTLAAEHGVDLTLAAPDPPFMLVADERRVLQILLNVMSNAVRYSPSGAEVRVAAGLARDGRAFFRVEDDGPGMTAEERELALSRFGRSDAARIRYPDGAGLGLPISAELAARHGGALALESEEGRGVRVTVLFPVDRVRPGPSEVSAVAE